MQDVLASHSWQVILEKKNQGPGFQKRMSGKAHSLGLIMIMERDCEQWASEEILCLWSKSQGHEHESIDLLIEGWMLIEVIKRGRNRRNGLRCLVACLEVAP